MGTQLTCDGCGMPLATGPDVSIVGRLDPVTYCLNCWDIWTDYTEAETAQRAELVRAMEAWRTAALARLRTTLRRLPDEFMRSVNLVDPGTQPVGDLYD